MSYIPFCACIKQDELFSQIHFAAEEHLFLFDYWRGGVQYAEGQSPHLVTPTGKGQFRIATPQKETPGGNAEYAVSLLLGNLPPRCGLAVCDDADRLNAS